MSKLRVISLVIFVLVGLTGFILYPCKASPELPKASVSITSPTLYGWSIPYGQKIAVYVEIHVEKSSPVPLENPYIFITITKPNGQVITVKKLIKDKINPGDIKGYTFKLDVVADQPGTWMYKVELWVCVKNKWYKLDEKTGAFIVQAIPKAEVVIVDIGEKKTVVYGQKITFKIKICVKKESPVPLNGFKAYVWLERPDGRSTRIDIVKDDKIRPGECKVYTITSNCVADKIGIWKFKVRLYTKDENHHLDYKTATFEVYGIPKAHIEYLEIYGYAVTASMICAGLALVLSRVVR